MAEYGILGDFLHFSYSHRPIFTKLGETTDVDTVMNPQHFGSDPVDIRIRINLEIRTRVPDHFRSTFGPWRSLRSLTALVTVVEVAHQ